MTPFDPSGNPPTGATMGGMGVVERAWDWIAYDVMQRVPAWRRVQAAAYARNLAAGEGASR